MNKNILSVTPKEEMVDFIIGVAELSVNQLFIR